MATQENARVVPPQQDFTILVKGTLERRIELENAIRREFSQQCDEVAMMKQKIKLGNTRGQFELLKVPENICDYLVRSDEINTTDAISFRGPLFREDIEAKLLVVMVQFNNVIVLSSDHISVSGEFAVYPAGRNHFDSVVVLCFRSISGPHDLLQALRV
ncbi:hypothetical protein Ddc_08621 [Ditylenchus destructor]|nr:hypothetical protein Ddc_08621 [Ditylenchus destructor]